MPASYFPLDVNFFDHPKTVGLSDKAVRLYLSSIAYASRLMTDGFVAAAIAGRLVEWDHLDPDAQTPEDCAAELVKAHLWEPVQGGYEVHDFLEHNRSREERLGEREAERRRKAAWRDKQRQSPRDDPDPGDGGVPPGHVPPGDEVSHRDRRDTETEEKRREEVQTIVEQARPIDDTTAVFHAWQATTGKTGSRLDDKRRRKITVALKAYPLDDVLDAVQGWQHSPHHCGANDTGTVYNELTLLLRDAGHIEKFRDLWRHPPPMVLGKATARAKQTYDEMRKWAGGDNGDKGRVDPDRGPPQRQLPGSTG